MKVVSMPSGPIYKRAFFPHVFFLLLALLLVLPSISGQSLWIDEATTAFYAQQDSLGDLFRAMGDEEGSEVQMPLGVFMAYGFGQALGTSEYALRLPNILWLGISLLALFSLGCRYQMPWLPLLFALHPMVWFYADEARPYALQFACASVVLWSATRLMYESPLQTRTLCWFWGAGLALCASSLLAAIIFAAWAFIVFVGYAQWRYLTRAHVKICGVALLGLIALAGYYVWTVWRGAGGAKLWALGWANPAFALFEFGGFMGFSPGRVALREAGRAGGAAAISALQPYIIPIVALALVYGVIVLGSRRVWTSSIPRLCLIWLSGGVFAIAIVCAAVGFPFWGRHLAPLFPVMILALGCCIQQLASRLRTIMLILLLALYAASSTNQRFNEQHRKDDYRGAVAFAQASEEHGARVLWVANGLAATYYGYNPESLPEKISAGLLEQQYDVVALSKPDIFDPDHQVVSALKNSSFQQIKTFSAFQIYGKDPVHAE